MSAILLLSGPSGAGKSTLIKELVQEIGPYYFSISTTTRAPREGEVDGVDYFFVSKEEFERDIKEDMFLEYANVHGNYYGTSLRPVMTALQKDEMVIFDIDVQGEEQVVRKLRDVTTTVFITTPSLEVLKERLYSRGTDAKDVIEKRINNAKKEILCASRYDFVVVNDDLSLASEQMRNIAKIVRYKKPSQEIQDFINQWC